MRFKKALVTGGAGFIGSNLIERLLANNISVLCYDNFCNSYSPTVKAKNISDFESHNNFLFQKGDIRDYDVLLEACRKFKPECMIHLAAIGGIRNSFSRPHYYHSVNVEGTESALSVCNATGIQKIIYASSSSIYGNDKQPTSTEAESLIDPLSPYAHTKVQGEHLCELYAQKFGLEIVSFRFFSVYGPRQRPDMAVSQFSNSIIRNETIAVYGDGTATRDFTYISDIVDGIMLALDTQISNFTPINIGSNNPHSINELIESLSSLIGRKANIDYQKSQPGEAINTNADIRLAEKLIGYTPKITLASGLEYYLNFLHHEQRPPSKKKVSMLAA